MSKKINMLIAQALNESNSNQKMQSIINFESRDVYEYKRFVNLLNTDYSSAFNKALDGDIILRGTSPKGQIVIGSPGNRVSRNTANFYTRLLSDILPAWKDYPKRNHSFICTENYNTAAYYRSTRYLMLPTNRSKIGICPSKDIWNSFKTLRKLGISDLSEFNSELVSMMSFSISMDIDYWDKHHKNYPTLNMLYGTTNITSMDTYFKQKSIQEILQLFAEFENLCRNSKFNDEKLETSTKFIKTVLRRILDKNEHLIDILNEILSPEANNFELTSIENYSSNDTREVWTDGKCLMLDMDIPFYYKYYVKNSLSITHEAVYNFIKKLIKMEPKLKDLFDILINKMRYDR